MGDDRPVLVVVDNFPSLVQRSPSLPSVLQAAYRRLKEARPHSRVRLLLCGPDTTVLRKLLCGPDIRETASLHLTVSPFEFREAARLWGTDDPRLAMLLHSVVGGTAAYRYEVSYDETPASAGDFDAWVCRTVLNRHNPLFS